MIVSLSMPNIYKPIAALIPTTAKQQSGTTALSACFGGITPIVNDSLGGGIDEIATAIETNKSRRPNSTSLNYKLSND